MVLDGGLHQMNETKTLYPQTDLTIIFKTG